MGYQHLKEVHETTSDFAQLLCEQDISAFQNEVTWPQFSTQSPKCSTRLVDQGGAKGFVV